MTEAPVLIQPNFNEKFILKTDASGLGMGAVLIQQAHPICYYSKQLCSCMLNASTYVRELCAIPSIMKKWCTYLLGKTFTIHTDQRSLQELMTQVIQTHEQQFYLAKLLGYSYEIVYKQGAQNNVVDALSRIHCLALFVPHFEFLQKFKKNHLLLEYEFQALSFKVEQEPNNYKDFQIVDQVLFLKGKFYIP